MFCYSTDEELFCGREVSRETAAHIALTETEADKVWTAEIIEVTAKHYFQEDTLDILRDRAYDDMGDYAEGWLDDVTNVQQRELHDAILSTIDAWASKHNHHPRFFDIKNIQEHIRDDQSV